MELGKREEGEIESMRRFRLQRIADICDCEVKPQDPVKLCLTEEDKQRRNVSQPDQQWQLEFGSVKEINDASRYD